MPLVRSAHNGATCVTMGEGKLARIGDFLGRVSRGAAVGAALAAGVLLPRPASANQAVADLEADLAHADEAVTLYEPVSIKKRVTLSTYGVAGGASVLAMGGALAISVKKEKKAVQEDIDALERECERMEQFKKEFLDGEVSDRSLFASFSKAVKDKLPEENVKTLSAEDEFEKNVQAFLDEENDKADKKNKPEYNMGKGGATLLERPGDIDGSKTDEWLNDVDYEDKPAEINADQLKALQRMFGTSSEE